jgi:hypothetical protein
LIKALRRQVLFRAVFYKQEEREFDHTPVGLAVGPPRGDKAMQGKDNRDGRTE